MKRIRVPMLASPLKFCLFWVFIGWLPVTILSGQESLPDTWDWDSTLRSVHFVDHDLGWAVGDRGTILRTEDGGRNWHSITSPRDLVWTDVFFINEKVGWIAGGFFRSSSKRNEGLIIRTIDGGKSWQNYSQNGLPFIRRLEFEDEQSGWIQCEPNALYPAGILLTRDGGHTWTTPPGVTAAQMKFGIRTSDGRYIGTNADRDLVQLDRSGLGIPVKLPNLELQDLVVAGSDDLVLIGNGKLFRVSSDGKLAPAGERPLQGELIRLNRVVKRGTHLWAVGSPGSVVLVSCDNGQSWEPHRTGQTEPLESVFFLDEDRGWAVGSMGKIMTTKDGGRTWFAQRNRPVQAGVMNLASRENHLRPTCLALLSGSFSHRCVANLVAENQLLRWSDRIRVGQGLNRLGVADVDRCLPGDSGVLLQIARSIRTWKPSVIVLDERDTTSKKWIKQGIEAAASPEYFPEMIELGLEPWTVQKVVSVSGTQELDYSTAVNQYSAHLGRTASLQSRFACKLLNVDDVPLVNLHYRAICSSSSLLASGQGITMGTMAYSNPNCRRTSTELEINNMQQFRSVANWQSSLEQLARHLVLSPLDETSWKEQVTAATSGMDRLTYSFFLEDLAATYHRTGKPVMADHTERLILQMALDTEVGEESLWKMIQRYGSVESNQELNRLVGRRMAAARRPQTGVLPASANLPLDPVRSLQPIAASDTAAGAEESATLDVTPASLNNAAQLVEIFRNRFPALNANPDRAMQLAWLSRISGNRSALDRLLDSMDSQTLSPLTRRRLLRERQLLQADQPVTGSRLVRDASRERMVLDARLTEEVWKSSRSELTDNLATRTYFAADAEYFYVAAELDLKNPAVPQANHRRTRDESLSGYDRVQFFIDFDRDYCSGIELTVDVRGSCNDALWRDSITRDSSYDPRWYVASRVEGTRWVVEFAIPLEQLPWKQPSIGGLAQPAAAHTAPAWLVGTRRIEAGGRNAGSTDSFLNDETILLFSPRDAEPAATAQ